MSAAAPLLQPDYAVRHDPGGKVRHRLAPGVSGGATFSPCGRYRRSLYRTWGEDGDCAPYWLWIGLNPSVADAEANDPTVSREVGFTRRGGATLYVKVNLCDWRATNPKHLPEPKVAQSAGNLEGILQYAHGASRVILAFGAVPKAVRPLAYEMVAQLRDQGIPLHCLGVTADGSPRHPLYIRSDAEMVLWAGWKR